MSMVMMQVFRHVNTAVFPGCPPAKAKIGWLRDALSAPLTLAILRGSGNRRPHSALSRLEGGGAIEGWS